MELMKVYNKLLDDYGEQGWWPVLGYKGVNPTKTGSVSGYHPGNYSFPRNEAEKFEIMCGALLTQNTNWQNVEKALINLDKNGLLDALKILNVDIDYLKDLIRPAGYYNQKAERLKILARFFVDLDGRVPTRDELLGLKGVGFETADSILLYAYSFPIFVVDSYTRRFFRKLGFIDGGEKYDEIRKFAEDNLEKDYKIFQEFHALIVEHAKRGFPTIQFF